MRSGALLLSRGLLDTLGGVAGADEDAGVQPGVPVRNRRASQHQQGAASLR